MLRLNSAFALRSRLKNLNATFPKNRSVDILSTSSTSSSLLLTTIPSRGFVAMIARGGAGVVAALGIVYIAYEAAIRLEMTQMRSIRKTIYKPQAELLSFNPGSLFLPRPDKTAFLAEVFSADPSGPILITGPQGSGKTAAIKQVLKGRFQTVYLDLRAQPVTTGEALTLAFVEQAGFLMPPRELVGRAVFASSATSSQTASFETEKAFRLIREVLRADKASGLRGWISPGSNGQPVITPPLLCIDELNVSDVSSLSEDPAFWRFIEWSLYMTDNRLANVAISCSTEVAEMLDAHPGFRARRHRIFFDFPRARSVAHYFKSVVNTQLRDVCGAVPRPGGAIAKSISEAAAAAKVAAAAAAVEAKAQAEAIVNGTNTGKVNHISNQTSSTSSLSLWSFFFGSSTSSLTPSTHNITKIDTSIDSLPLTESKLSVQVGNTNTMSSLSSSVSTTSVNSSSPVLEGQSVSPNLMSTATTSSTSSLSTSPISTSTSPAKKTPISSPSTVMISSLSSVSTETTEKVQATTTPTLTMVAQLEGEGPSAAFSFARAAALAAQTERDKSAAAAAAAAVVVTNTSIPPPGLVTSSTEGITPSSLTVLSSPSITATTVMDSLMSTLNSTSSSTQVIPSSTSSFTVTSTDETLTRVEISGIKNDSEKVKNNISEPLMATMISRTIPSSTLSVVSNTDNKLIKEISSSVLPNVQNSQEKTEKTGQVIEQANTPLVSTAGSSLPLSTLSNISLNSSTSSTTPSTNSNALQKEKDSLSQVSLVNYFVHGSRYEFAPWGRTQSRYYLLEDHEIARIVETIGGNLKDLHTVVAAIMAGKHWASALERLVADSADMVESTLDVLLAASSSESTSGGSSTSSSTGTGTSANTGPTTTTSGIGGGGGSSGPRASGGRRGLRLRLLARAPLPQWDFAANPRPDRLAAYTRFLRAWDLMVELDKRKYVQRRELVDSIFAGCPHELEYLVDVGLAVSVNIKGMTRVANGGSSAQAQVAIEQFTIGMDGSVLTKVPGVYIAAASPRLRMAFRSLTRDALLVRHASRVRASVRLAHLRIEEARLSSKLMPDATAERSYWHGQVQQLLVRDTTLRSAVARELIALQAAAPVTAVDFLTKGTMTPEALKEGEGAPPTLEPVTNLKESTIQNENVLKTMTQSSPTITSTINTPLMDLNNTSTQTIPPSSSTLPKWHMRDDPLSGVSDVPLLGASALSGQLEVALQSMREAETEVKSLRTRLAIIRSEIANEEAKVRILYESAQGSTSVFEERPERDRAVSWVLDGGFVPGPMSPSLSLVSPSTLTLDNATTVYSNNTQSILMSSTNTAPIIKNTDTVNSNMNLSSSSSSSSSLKSTSTIAHSSKASNSLTLSTVDSSTTTSTAPFTSASSGYYGSYQFFGEDREDEEEDEEDDSSEEEEEAGGEAWAARRQNKKAARQQKQQQERESASLPYSSSSRDFDRTEGEGVSGGIGSSTIKPGKRSRTVKSGSTKGVGEAQRKLGYSGWYKASNDREER